MAVSKSSKTTTQVEQQDHVYLELARVSRYLYKNTLYQKGTVYVFTPEDAKAILSLRDPQGLPVFIKAKPRTKLVEIPVDVQAVAVRPVGPADESLTTVKGMSPVGKLDLGDDDPELQAKLAAVDSAPERVEPAVPITV